MRAKISVIGAGNVGREAALWCAFLELGDVMVWNRTASIARGIALDISEAGPLLGFDAFLCGTGNLRDTRNSDVLVFTAGVPRKAGQTREQLVKINAKIIYPLLQRAARLSPHAVILMVTNPLDAMAYLAWKASRFRPRRVLGLSGVLDSSRFSSFVARELQVSLKDVESLTLGSHGEAMVPLSRFATVHGVPVKELLAAQRLRGIEEHTRKAGEEIIRLLGTNASVSTGAAIAKVVETIVRDERGLLPCSVYLSGQYGVRNLFMGVPVILGAKGVERVVELRLTQGELRQLQLAAVHIREITRLAWKAVR